LPGVGAFDNGTRNLHDRGLFSVLNNKVLRGKTPILGLCLGIQLFALRSEEGKLSGLNWIDADVVRFRSEGVLSGLKIPHIGWNFINIEQPCPIWRGLESKDMRFYFVHSFHVVPKDSSNVLATSFHGFKFVAAVIKGNIMGMQFHPEKSHKFGMKLLQNFVESF
jgi:glutamine amidotransferase